MEKIIDFNDIEIQTQKHPLLLLYATITGCVVCHDTLPRVDELMKEMNIPVFEVNASEIPMARGQLGLFTAPVAMVFFHGREVFRQGRFIDLQELRSVIDTYKEKR